MSSLNTVTEKLAEAAAQAGLAYEFNPGSYTMSALQACLAAKAALDDVVVMPKAVFDAMEVLIGEYHDDLWPFGIRRRIEFRREEAGEIEEADELEAAVNLYEEWQNSPAHVAQTRMHEAGTAREKEPNMFDAPR
jgi:hypothetical protein